NLYANTGAVIALDGEWGAGKTTFVQKSPTFKNVVASGAKIGLKVVGEVAKGLLKKTTGADADIIKESVDELVSQCYQQMSDYQNKKVTHITL
ncbi:MAG: tRNA (adenosine(37)-N6)-threonylcarbamoyltransferase complex ATPase subunit type 1 TsaE, partial [Muribaculaceae bacterium]|nr:tRNA (adenosine(37)-N6)-threonylcarbamoyltransferase complex ATPase subunit type 1 TsaE [Muribaculaceae bacterium]